MGLKITKASDPITVDRINMVLYAAPGLGKTSLAFTADKPLLLDFDRGAHRAANRGDSVTIETWSDVDDISADDLAPYSTVIVDTAGRALDVLTGDIIARNPKHGNGGALSLQGFGQLKSRFIAFLKMLNGFVKDVVLIAHMEEQRSGDDVLERLDVQGGSKAEIYKAADAMGRLVFHNRKRLLLFSPSDAAFGKNPAGLDPLEVPDAASPDFDGFLASVIQTTKDRLNELTEAQKETLAEQKWFTENLPKIEGADGINQLIDRSSASRALKGALHNRATALGLIFDKNKGEYIAQEAA